MGKFIEWSSEYNVGIKEIDEQHKTLVDLINRLDEAISNKTGSQGSQQIIADLIEYTKVHFALEEQLMQTMGFPGFDRHRSRHIQLIDDVGALKEKMETSGRSISFELMAFLRGWLLRHIKESDQQYAAYFREQKMPSNASYLEWKAQVNREPRARPWWKFW